MKKTIIFLITLFALATVVIGGNYMEPLTKGYADTLYCKITGCTILDLIVDTLTVYNFSVIGQVFNVTMNLVTWNITESFNVGGNLNAKNITADNIFAMIDSSYIENEHWVNESGDTMTGKFNVEVNLGGAATIGGSNSAIGDYAVAMGDNTNAIGLTSTTMGWSTTANETASTAMGLDTTASGGGSTAMGYDTTASGTASTAMGRGTTASGDYSTAMGRGTTASGHYSTAMGYNTTASTWYSTALGVDTIASGGTSIAMGWGTTASGNHSTAIGRKIEAFAQYTVGIGLDDIYRNITQPHTMSIMGGNVGIGTTSPMYKLEVVGNTNIIGNLTIGGTTNITHSLQDAYDDGSVITVGQEEELLINLTHIVDRGTDKFSYLNITNGTSTLFSVDSKGTVTGVTLQEAYDDGQKINITGNSLQFDIRGEPGTPLYIPGEFVLNLFGVPTYNDFVVRYGPDGDDYNAFRIANHLCVPPNSPGCIDNHLLLVRSNKWLPFEDANISAGTGSDLGGTDHLNETYRWKDLYLAGDIKGTGSGESLFMSASSGDVRFGFENFNITNNGTVVTSKNITLSSLIVNERVYLSANSYMEADANGNINVW